MRSYLALSLAVLSACASGAPTPGVAAPRQVRIEGAGSVNLNQNTYAHVERVEKPVDLVWAALPFAFEAMSIPITAIDSAHHVIRNDGLKARRVLGGTPLGVYLDCGSTQVGENADSYDVNMTLLAEVQPDESGNAKLSLTLESMARPVSFSRDYTRCTTRGKLEERLTAALKKHIM